MKDVFGPYHVNCVNIEISSLGPSLNIQLVRFRLEKYYGINSNETRAGLHDMTNGGGNYRIFTKVTPGWAYDFEVWAREFMPDIGLEFIGSVEPNKANIMNPFSVDDRKRHDDFIRETNAEVMSIRASLGKASDALNSANNIIERLRQERTDNGVRIGHLQRDNYKLSRALQGKFNPVRVDPNDPDHYIIRPSALSEMRLLNQLSNDVVNITFQMLKPKTLCILKEKGNVDGMNFYDPPSPEYMDKNGIVLKQVRRACRPNTRGSLNGTVRVLGALKTYAALFHTFENACVLRSNYNAGRHLLKSKFNW